MTICYQGCQNCPHLPHGEYRAAPFDRDVAMRSLEFGVIHGYADVVLHDQDLEVALLPVIDAEMMNVALREARQRRAGILV